MARHNAALPLTAILLAGLSAGCLNPFDSCPTEGRTMRAESGMTADAVVPATATDDSGSASVSFLQFRGGKGNQKSLSWFIRASVPADSVESVHIHAGLPGETGSILYTFRGGQVGPDDVITQRGPTLWGGSTEGFEEMCDAVLAGEAYVDVHTLGQPDGVVRGQLSVDMHSDWHDSCT
jgi:hypothetical protein